MENNNGENLNYMATVNFKEVVSTTHTVGFFGELAEGIVLFVAKLCSKDSAVLVIDLSSRNKLFFNVAGTVEDKTINFRKVCYTTDIGYYEEYRKNYDIVLVYSDLVNIPYMIMKKLKFAYLSFGIRKFSLLLLEKMLEGFDTDIPYSLVCREDKILAEKQYVRDYLQMLCIKKKGPEHIYFVPNDIKDINSLIRFEYGVFNVFDLSQPMFRVVSHVYERLRKLSGKSQSCVSFSSEQKPYSRWMM